MNIVVCLKQTFDTEERIVLEQGRISEDDVEFVINPYCEYAVEEAIRLKEKHGGNVTVISVGPRRAEQAIRQAMAMGVDQGILVDTEGIEVELDAYSTSVLLEKVIVSKQIAYDVILCGYMTTDHGSAQVGARLAELLNIAHISTVTKVEIEDRTIQVEKDVEGDIEKIESNLPILLTAQQGLNEPRYPRLPDIMKARRKPLTRMELSDLGLDAAAIEAKTEQISLALPPPKKTGQILTGEMEEQVKELVHLLHHEAKVI